MRVTGMWLTLVLAVATTVAVAAEGVSSPLVADPSYVVQIHASRDGFVPPADGAELRAQLMTTASGQRFECFLPLSPLQKQQQALERAAAQQIAGPEDVDGEAQSADTQRTRFLGFARAAVKKVKPSCVQFVDVVDRWVYEVCPGVLIRKVSLKRRVKKPTGGSGDDQLPRDTPPEMPTKKTHEVQELAAFASDEETKPALSYEEFTDGEMQTRLSTYKKPLYTQVFRARGLANGQVEDIQVQFLCSATARDDAVVGVDWRYNDETTKEPVAFAVASRLFCNPKHSDPDEKFSVGSLLEPLAELNTCIKRNEGWWTYEFCVGRSIRQYHRENDGKVTAEFSLGFYDGKENEQLEASGASLVTEHIDATHDAARPAYVEIYTGGTHCKEFDVSTPRRSRVYYYCNQGSANHHIVSVKETQTCTYTIKISSPTVCDHPHFITEEQKTEDKAEVVHCIPFAAPTEEHVSQSSTGTRPPAAASHPRSEVQEVEVTAT